MRNGILDAGNTEEGLRSYCTLFYFYEELITEVQILCALNLLDIMSTFGIVSVCVFFSVTNCIL